ncbi:hypothetical protein BRADI_5g05166v3 [Brachypodium distachyon]|uniref:Uncharacterized protein n=1 Tax=Brachypodium distachyon TaxID=15368 RepID=A0A2K2CFJ7_BRADI|nr:hypothetical protein BRADI_5g05166v3 [Brachypodium distachyon]
MFLFSLTQFGRLLICHRCQQSYCNIKKVLNDTRERKERDSNPRYKKIVQRISNPPL